MKTNAARYLDSLNIPYELREYTLTQEEFSAPMVAEKIGMAPEQVFKTLLCATGEREYAFAVIAADQELDFKKLAQAAGARRAEMAPIKELQGLTGYIRGGVTVFGAKKSFPVFVDETMELLDQIAVSAGVRGSQMLLSPEDYLRASEATVANLARAAAPAESGS